METNQFSRQQIYKGNKINDSNTRDVAQQFFQNLKSSQNSSINKSHRKSSLQQLDNTLLQRLTMLQRGALLDNNSKNQLMKKLFFSYEKMQQVKQRAQRERVVFVQENLNCAFIILTKFRNLIEEKNLISKHHGFKSLFFLGLRQKSDQLSAIGTKLFINKTIKRKYEQFFDKYSSSNKQVNRQEILLIFLDEFLKEKEKKNQQEFFFKLKRFLISYDVFRNSYGREVFEWREGQKIILQDMDNQPRALFSLTRRNLNYFKFLTFMKYFKDFFDEKKKKELQNQAFQQIKNKINENLNQQEQERLRRLQEQEELNRMKIIEEEQERLRKEQEEQDRLQRLQKKYNYKEWDPKKQKAFRQGLKTMIYQTQEVKEKNGQNFLERLKTILESSIKNMKESKGISVDISTEKNEKQYGSFNILNRLSKQKENDIEMFKEYLEYLIQTRKKQAFDKILSLRPKQKNKVIHAKVDLLKRPIIVEELSNNFQTYVSNQENSGYNNQYSPSTSFIRMNSEIYKEQNGSQNVFHSVFQPPTYSGISDQQITSRQNIEKTDSGVIIRRKWTKTNQGFNQGQFSRIQSQKVLENNFNEQEPEQFQYFQQDTLRPKRFSNIERSQQFKKRIVTKIVEKKTSKRNVFQQSIQKILIQQKNFQKISFFNKLNKKFYYENQTFKYRYTYLQNIN